MRTKEVTQISEDERDFQIRLDGVVRAYEKRIHEMKCIRDDLRKIRKCQYCGGKYYANGLCLSCYQAMRSVGGDPEEFVRKRQRYGYRRKKLENWMLYFWSEMNKNAVPPEPEKIEEWCNDFMSLLNDEDKTIVNLLYKDGWSIRGCADVLGVDRAKILSRVTSMRTTAKRIEKLGVSRAKHLNGVAALKISNAKAMADGSGDSGEQKNTK